MAEVRIPPRPPRRLAGPGAAIARAEGFEAHAASMEARRENPGAMTRTAEVSRKTGETDVSLTLGLDGTGAGTRAHRRRLPRPHARPARPPRAPRPDRRRQPATSRPARTTRSRTPASSSARRSTARSATAPGSPATATPSSPWTRRAPPCAIDVSGRPYCAYGGLTLPPGDIAGFEHEAAEEFFRAVASAARLTLHLELQAGTNAHHMIEACFKAFARALRVAVAVDPSEPGIPSTKGTLT